MSTDLATLRELYRTSPGRLAVLSFAPVVLASAQSLNALVHGAASPLVAVFVLGMLAFAAGATSHSLASVRTESLEAEFVENRP